MCPLFWHGVLCASLFPHEVSLRWFCQEFERSRNQSNLKVRHQFKGSRKACAIPSAKDRGGCSSAVERSLCMWKAPGSIPGTSTLFAGSFFGHKSRVSKLFLYKLFGVIKFHLFESLPLSTTWHLSEFNRDIFPTLLDLECKNRMFTQNAIKVRVSHLNCETDA